MARRTALASNPLSLENLSRSLDAATKLRSLVERGGSGTIRKQSTLRLEWLRPNPDQPRKAFDCPSMEELEASIATYGILEPLLVRFTGEHYQIICGERRYRAAMKLGFEEVPVVVREASDHEALVLALQENLHRNDLQPVEEAEAFRRLLASGLADSIRGLAKLLGISHTRISRKLALLELPDELREQLVRRAPGAKPPLTERHVRALRRLTSSSERNLLADQVRTQDLSVEQTEQLVDRVLEAPDETDAVLRHVESVLPGAGSWTVGSATLEQTAEALIIRLPGEDRPAQIALLEEVLASLRRGPSFDAISG